MPKLKPISKPEDMLAIPTTEPILVSLEPEPTGAAPETEPEVQKPEQQQDDGAKQLQDQLTALRAAEDTQKRRADAAEAREREARQQAATARTERDTSEHDLMVGSLQSAQSELASAEAEMASAYERADGPAIAKANAKIARASARIVSFEGAVAELETRKTQQPAQEPNRQERQQPLDPVTAINSNNALLPKEKEWLLTHQDALNRNDELNVGHVRAMKQGIQRGSDAYFQFMNDFMGYQAQRQNGNDDTERQTSMSAPVSRESPSMSNGQRPSNQVTLTPEERDMAKSMGLTDIAYARNKLKMQEDKRTNPERYGRQ